MSMRRPRGLAAILGVVGTYLLAGLFAGAAAFPLYWMVVAALQPGRELFSYPPRLLPRLAELGVFGRLFATQPMLLWIGNTVLIAGGVAVVSVVLAVLAAYALSRFRFAGRRGLQFALLLTQMLPSTVLIVPLFILFRQLHLLNTRSGIVLAQAALVAPIAVWIIKAFMDTIPREIEDAALIDGCSRLGVLRRVTLPLAVPSVVASFAMCFFEAWNVFVYALTFAPDRELWVSAVGLASWIGELTTPVEIMMSGAVVFTIPSVVVFLALQQRLVGGLSAGAIQ
jgi:multiple sugar transport system permease protein